MLKVSDIVAEIILGSQTELTSLSRGLLNLSAFAQQIQPNVEKKLGRSVAKGTIVVALSRFARTATIDPLLPNIKLDTIALQSGLCELAFDKSRENKAKAASLYKHSEFLESDFLTVTYGVGEISVFLPEELSDIAIALFAPIQPKLSLKSLAALTVRFSEQYIETPNIYFGLLQSLAVKRINIVELISTYTELTFLVRQNDVGGLFTLMHSLIEIEKQKTRRSR